MAEQHGIDIIPDTDRRGKPADLLWMWAGGLINVETVAFGDHHRYTTADVEQLRQIAAERGATGFVTTEKDRVKLPAAMLERLQLIGPVCAVKLDAKFVDEAEVMREVEARCR